MAIDVLALWDFGDPAMSEQRFREALDAASADDQLILQTQIARSYGIRKDFETARRVLASVECELPKAGTEAIARHMLELGRTYCSTTHPPETQTKEVRHRAGELYIGAFGMAKHGHLDYLAIDALHMMTMVDPSPEAQLEWNRKAIACMESSDQPEAKKWEGSLRNNLGYALHLAGRYEEALAEFERALEVREQAGKEPGIRIAKWMIGWTLRAMGRFEEALHVQLLLEKEWDEEGAPDPYVYEELEHLYRCLGEEGKAECYRAKLADAQ